MKTIMSLMSILSLLGLASTLICGFWIKQQTDVDVSSINFHMIIGSASVLLTVVTLILFMLKK